MEHLKFSLSFVCLATALVAAVALPALSPGDDNLMKYVYDAAEHTSAMQRGWDEQLRVEASKIDKVKADKERETEKLKREIELWQDKVKAMEVKVKEAEERVKPAADDAMKEGQRLAQKAVMDEQAKQMKQNEEYKKQIAGEASKIEKAKVEFEKKATQERIKEKAAADTRVAEEMKRITDVKLNEEKVKNEGKVKMDELQGQLKIEDKELRDSFEEEKMELKNEHQKDMAEVQKEKDKRMNDIQRKAADAEKRMPLEKEIHKKAYAPKFEVVKKEKEDLAKKIKEEDKHLSTSQAKVAELTGKLKLAQEQSKINLEVQNKEMAAKIKEREDYLKRVLQEKEVLAKNMQKIGAGY